MKCWGYLLRTIVTQNIERARAVRGQTQGPGVLLLDLSLSHWGDLDNSSPFWALVSPSVKWADQMTAEVSHSPVMN